MMPTNAHPDDGQLHAYADGELGPAQRAEVDRHLAACAGCRARLEEARRIARRSSHLLAALEPGQVRAPAAAGAAEPEPDGGAVEPGTAADSARTGADLARPGGARQRIVPARRAHARWVSPGLAWAASLALAFALGWLARAENRRWVATREADRVSAVPDTATPYFGRERATADAKAVEPPPPGATAVAREAPEMGPGEAGAARAAPEAAELARMPEAAPPEGRRVARTGGEFAEGGRVQGAARPHPFERADSALHPPAAHEPAAVAHEPAAAPAPGFAAARVPAEEPAADPVLAAPESLVEIPPDDAAAWLGAPPRRLPELAFVRAEVAPGRAVRGARPDRPVVRLVYRDAAGHEIALLQQWAPEPAGAETEDSGPTLTVAPSGVRAYRWTADAYRLILAAPLPPDVLRELAARVR